MVLRRGNNLTFELHGLLMMGYEDASTHVFQIHQQQMKMGCGQYDGIKYLKSLP
jgi:hypothetical protein